MPNQKRILVDMSATILHHGHTRLLRKAAELGEVVVALTADIEVKKRKGYLPEIPFAYRKEILLSIRYVSQVIESPWLINDDYLEKNNIDLLVHGNDNSNDVSPEKLLILPRTEGVSSSNIRSKSAQIFNSLER